MLVTPVPGVLGRQRRVNLWGFLTRWLNCLGEIIGQEETLSQKPRWTVTEGQPRLSCGIHTLHEAMHMTQTYVCACTYMNMRTHMLIHTHKEIISSANLYSGSAEDQTQDMGTRIQTGA